MWNVLFVDGWDMQAGEAISGGRCLESASTRAEALEVASDWSRLVRRLYGRGLVAVTDPDHQLEALLHPHSSLCPVELTAA